MSEFYIHHIKNCIIRADEGVVIDAARPLGQQVAEAIMAGRLHITGANVWLHSDGSVEVVGTEPAHGLHIEGNCFVFEVPSEQDHE